MSALLMLAGPNGSGKSTLRDSGGLRIAMQAAGNPEIIDPDAMSPTTAVRCRRFGGTRSGASGCRQSWMRCT